MSLFLHTHKSVYIPTQIHAYSQILIPTQSQKHVHTHKYLHANTDTHTKSKTCTVYMYMYVNKMWPYSTVITLILLSSNYCLTTVVFNWHVQQLLLKLLLNYCSVEMKLLGKYCYCMVTFYWHILYILANTDTYTKSQTRTYSQILTHKYILHIYTHRPCAHTRIHIYNFVVLV